MSPELSAALNVDNTISAAIVVAATVEDFRISANVAQVMGHTKWGSSQLILYYNNYYYVHVCALLWEG